MRLPDYEAALDNIPRYVAVFKVTNPPDWLPENYAKALASNGNEAVYDPWRGSMTVAGMGVALKSSHVSFYEYRKVNP